MGLSDTERNRIIDKISNFQLADARQEFARAIDEVKDEIEEEIKKFQESAKAQRELIIDVLVCFIPLPKSIKDAAGSSQVIEGTIDAFKEVTKFVTKEKIFTDSENEQLAFQQDYTNTMLLGFRRRLNALYDYLDARRLNRTEVPDRLLEALRDKFLPDNFRSDQISEKIRTHLQLLEKFVFSYGVRSVIQQYISQTTTITSIQLRPVKGYLKNEVVYMPVFCQQTMVQDGRAPEIDVVKDGFKFRNTTIRYEFIPTAFIDAAIVNAQNSDGGVITLTEAKEILDFKSPKFLTEFYGKNASKMMGSVRSRSGHFRNSVLRKTVTPRNFWTGELFEYTSYDRISRISDYTFLEIESF